MVETVHGGSIAKAMSKWRVSQWTAISATWRTSIGLPAVVFRVPTVMTSVELASDSKPRLLALVNWSEIRSSPSLRRR